VSSAPRRSAAACVIAAALAAVPACKDKPADQGAPAPIAGLGAIPADADGVIMFDVPKLADSALVMRGVELMLQRDPTIEGRWSNLATACGLGERGAIRKVTLALGPAPAPAAGAAAGGPPALPAILMIVTGDLTEATLPTCVKTAFGTGGGDVTARTAGGRTIYTVTEQSRSLFFAFGQADTVVVSTSAPWLEQALGRGPKVTDKTAAIAALLARADQTAPLWATGKTDGPIVAGLVRATAGLLEKGPTAVFVALDPTSGLRAELAADLATEQDAKALEQFANTQLRFLSLVAQAKSLGPTVAKLAPVRAGTNVKFAISLSPAEVNQLMQAIDRPAEDPQDSPPSVDANPAPAAGSAQ
jgi:hypothetical protein